VKPVTWKEATIHGLTWSLIANILKQALNFVIGVIMARLLSPEEFGLVGMVLIFSGLASIIVDQGMGAAIIQKDDIEPRHLDSIFCLNVIFGVLIAALLSAASPLIAAFYHEPVLRPLTVMISLNYLISSFSVVPTALLAKQIDFKRLALIDTVAVLGSGAVGIGLALSGLGVWSLVWQALVLAAMTAFLLMVMSTWRPRLRIDARAVKDIAGYSTHLLGFNVMNYFERNTDNFLIGKFIGAAPLGIYSRAYQLMLFPVTQVSWVISRVMFPALSSIKDDLVKVKRVYLRAIQAIAFMTFPLMIGLIVVSRSFVLGALGEKWIATVEILEILCIVGLIQSITTTTGWIFNSQGRTDLQFRWGFLFSGVTVLSFIIGLRWGIRGVAICYLIGELAMLYWIWTIPARLIGLKFSEMLRTLSGPFFCAVVMGGVLYLLGRVLPPQAYFLDLLIRVPAGAAIYWLLTRGFRIQAYEEIRELILNRLHAKNP
jgi:PST family polysaccharide transporter